MKDIPQVRLIKVGEASKKTRVLIQEWRVAYMYHHYEVADNIINEIRKLLDFMHTEEEELHACAN